MVSNGQSMRLSSHSGCLAGAAVEEETLSVHRSTGNTSEFLLVLCVLSVAPTIIKIHF